MKMAASRPPTTARRSKGLTTGEKRSRKDHQAAAAAASAAAAGSGSAVPAEMRKRPRSSYIIFAQERRADLLENNPHLKSKVTEVAKLLGEKWRSLSEDEKSVYHQQASLEQQKYYLATGATSKKPKMSA